MSRRKGNKRERQAREIYAEAGFAVEKAVAERYGRTDFFGLFDFMAVRSDTFRFVQVKGGSASGIGEINEWAAEHCPTGVNCEFAVYYKKEGWRLVRALPDQGSYTTVYDERKDEDVGPHVDTPLNLGEGLTEFLTRR